MELVLSQGLVAIVDDDDPKEPWRWKWSAKVTRTTAYAMRTIYQGGRQKRLYLHRFLMSAKPGEEVDHENLNGLDCRRVNMRIATGAENRQNTPKRLSNRSGFKGVSWHEGRGQWKAQIKLGGQTTFLGWFDDPKAAGAAYDEAAKRLHKDFARTNRMGLQSGSDERKLDS